MAMVIVVKGLDGTEVEINPTPADHVAFEAKFEISVSDITKVTHLYWIAYATILRQKKTNLDFEAWLETIAEIEVVDANPKSSR